MRRDELVVLVLGPLDPQHVVEQQLVVVRRREPLQAEVRTVDHHLAQLAHLGVHPEVSSSPFLLASPRSRTLVPARPVDDLLDVGERADRGALAGRLDEAGGGVDLRPHRPGREVRRRAARQV